MKRDCVRAGYEVVGRHQTSTSLAECGGHIPGGDRRIGDEKVPESDSSEHFCHPATDPPKAEDPDRQCLGKMQRAQLGDAPESITKPSIGRSEASKRAQQQGDSVEC